MEAEPVEEPPSKRLRQLADRLERSLGEAAAIENDTSTVPGSLVRITPTRNDALGLVWIELRYGVVLETSGGPGGRWELSRSEEDIDFLEDIVESVIAGRVVEVFGPARSRVTVTLADGRTFSERGAVASEGCLPMPLWTKWGRKVHYAPYAVSHTR